MTETLFCSEFICLTVSFILTYLIFGFLASYTCTDVKNNVTFCKYKAEKWCFTEESHNKFVQGASIASLWRVAGEEGAEFDVD